MSTLSSLPINRPPTGISKIQYIATGDIENVVFKYPQNNIIELVPKEGKSWTEIYFTPKSVKISHEAKETSAGETHEYNIEHHIPYNRLMAAQNISQLSRKIFYLKITFINGNVRIFGEAEIGMRLKAKELPGTNPINPDGYNILWYGTFMNPASYDFNTHAIIPDPPPPPPPPPG
jgi:hypothetical protein